MYQNRVGTRYILALDTSLDYTHLSPCNIRRNEELHVTMLEDPQHYFPQVPLVDVATAFEKLCGCVLLPRLVLRPGLATVFTRLILLKLRLLLLLRTATWKQSREDEYGLDMKFFERSQVGLDTRCECEGKTTSCSKQRLPGRWLVNQGGEVVGSIDAQA